MSEFVTVAKVGDIPVGEGRAYEFGEQLVAVFNQDGTYKAIDDMCPHMGASLASGHFEDGIVACPWHGWSFDTADGSWCDNRRLKIDTFRVRVVGDEIQIAAALKEETAPKQTDVKGGEAASDCGCDAPAKSRQQDESSSPSDVGESDGE